MAYQGKKNKDTVVFIAKQEDNTHVAGVYDAVEALSDLCCVPVTLAWWHPDRGGYTLGMRHVGELCRGEVYEINPHAYVRFGKRRAPRPGRAQ